MGVHPFFIEEIIQRERPLLLPLFFLKIAVNQSNIFITIHNF
jgi:hypothetical protein